MLVIETAYVITRKPSDKTYFCHIHVLYYLLFYTISCSILSLVVYYLLFYTISCSILSLVLYYLLFYTISCWCNLRGHIMADKPPKIPEACNTVSRKCFCILVSRGIVHFKTTECQVGTLGQLPRNRMASKMATKRVFHSKIICIAFILFLNCSQMDTPDMGNK